MFDKIIEKIKLLENNFDKISEERKILLHDFSGYFSKKNKNNEDVNLIFICTHNSRRSHMSQIWAQAALYYYKVPNIFCYLGGTEAAAFNPRAVIAVKDSGFKVEKLDESDNPVYEIRYSENAPPLICFSKVYNDEFNPQRNFAAVMTCSHADENCPVVFGAEDRFPIKYDDPKEFDDTEYEGLK